MEPLTYAAISGGTSLLGGLLGGEDKVGWKKQKRMARETEEERFKWLVTGAKKAGFNPLTVLGATGGAQGHIPQQSSSPFGWKQALAGAIGSAGQAYLDANPVQSAYEKELTRNAELKNKVLESEMVRFNRNVTSAPTVARSGSFAPSSAPDGTGAPVMDLASLEAENWRVPAGHRNSNQYVLKMPDGNFYMLPKDWQPASGSEDLMGEQVGQINSAAAALKQGLISLGGGLGFKTKDGQRLKRVDWDPDTGQIHPHPDKADADKVGDLHQRGSTHSGSFKPANPHDSLFGHVDFGWDSRMGIQMADGGAPPGMRLPQTPWNTDWNYHPYPDRYR